MAVRADGAGSGLSDGLGGSGGESLGLDQGLPLAPGATRGVALAGAVTCPGGAAPDDAAEPVGLVVQARAADGTPRTVELAAPEGPAWRSAVPSACALGPDDAYPNEERPCSPAASAAAPAGSDSSLMITKLRKLSFAFPAAIGPWTTLGSTSSAFALQYGHCRSANSISSTGAPGSPRTIPS